MIVNNETSWLRMLVRVRGSVLTRTYPRIAAATIFALVVTAVELLTEVQAYSLTVVPFTLIGTALAIFLGFRNNAAYDRYWEGRKLWGQMVNSARSFTREVLTLIAIPNNENTNPAELKEFQTDLVQHMIAYVHALRHHLRNTDSLDEITPFLPVEELARLKSEKNIPNAILLEIARTIQTARQKDWISDYHVAVIENTLTDITNVQGGCERINSTPIPIAYTLLIHRLVAFYCFFLPFGIVNSVGWLTPVVVLLISHAFFGLDDIGDEIEYPFGTDPHHLALSAICRTIEVNLLQAVDSDHLPELLKPVDGILI